MVFSLKQTLIIMVVHRLTRLSELFVLVVDPSTLIVIELEHGIRDNDPSSFLTQTTSLVV